MYKIIIKNEKYVNLSTCNSFPFMGFFYLYQRLVIMLNNLCVDKIQESDVYM